MTEPAGLKFSGWLKIDGAARRGGVGAAIQLKGPWAAPTTGFEMECLDAIELKWYLLEVDPINGWLMSFFEYEFPPKVADIVSLSFLWD